MEFGCTASIVVTAWSTKSKEKIKENQKENAMHEGHLLLINELESIK